MNWVRPSVIVMLAITGEFFTGRVASSVFMPFATGLIVFKSRDVGKES